MSKYTGSLSNFNSLLDKATNCMQLELDSESINKICCSIDKGTIESSYAVQALYGKMTDENPRTVLFALRVLEKIFYECGNLAHRVICTENFMNALKDIIETTEYKLIRDTILELVQTWADKFKYLPQYSAPETLLKTLQANGYVFPGFGNNVALVSKKWQYDKNVIANSYEKSKLFSKQILEQSDYNDKDSRIELDTDMKNREDKFRQSLREIQEKKKRDFQKHQISFGVSTSYDKKDNGNVSNGQQFKLPYEENISKSYALPLEPKKIPESSQTVNKELQEYRYLKKEEFNKKQIQEIDDFNEILQLKNPEDKCLMSERYKKKCNHDSNFERDGSKLYPDVRKVKESREIINNNLEEVGKHFYATKSNDWADNNSHRNYTNNISSENQDREIQRAVEFSKTNTNFVDQRKLRSKSEDLKDKKALKKACKLSLLHMEPDSSSLEDDEKLQRAIDMSMADEEKVHFSEFSKSENNNKDNALLNYVIKLSLDESHEQKYKSSEFYTEYDIEPCVICKDDHKRLMSFKPCNHRCICNDCSETYISQQCPICRTFYYTITL